VLRAFKATFIKQLETKAYILLLWWGEMVLQSHAIERPEDAMKARGLIGRNLG
jgi:hypothetical protein